jgi:tape measure domain-containing protein
MVIEELFTRLGFQVDPKGIDKAKQALTGFKSFVGGLALGAGFVTLAKTGLDAAMTMEGLNAQFTVMTGSAERAKGVIDEIAAFAAKTPFDKLGLSNAAKTLMAFGMSADSVVPTLKMLGDVAGADQNKLNSLALVFGQIQSAGKLTGGDLLQLINQGFNPLTIISQKTGIAVADLKDQMSKGAITADMVTEAFRAATSAGGLFYGNLEAQSQTLQGRISTLKDNFVTALQNMAEAFLPLLKAGTDMLVAFDWSPVVGMVQAVGSALSGIPFDKLIANVRRLSFAVVLFATRDLDKTLANSLKAALARGVATFKGLEISFANFKRVAITGIKSISLAMKTALGPIGIALMAIEGFIEAYNWLKARSEHEATEKEKAWGKKYFKQKYLYEGKKTPEQVLSEFEENLENENQKLYDLQKKANLGGAEGRAASTELKQKSENVKDRKKTLDLLKQVYQEEYGIEWKSTLTPMVKDPNLGSGLNLEKQFADLEKTIKESTDATKKQTKATDSNTKAQEKFDISSLSRQAFDAAFNVKLKEFAIGSI